MKRSNEWKIKIQIKGGQGGYHEKEISFYVLFVMFFAFTVLITQYGLAKAETYYPESSYRMAQDRQ